jgi:GIY-YIG catalytic domain
LITRLILVIEYVAKKVNYHNFGTLYVASPLKVKSGKWHFLLLCPTLSNKKPSKFWILLLSLVSSNVILSVAIFLDIPTTVGLYAFRHLSEGLLYIGKAKNLRDRLRGGHKAFLWGWLDHYNPEDVRITFVTLNQWQKPGLLYELETLILQTSHPPYNVKIPREL